MKVNDTQPGLAPPPVNPDPDVRQQVTPVEEVARVKDSRPPERGPEELTEEAPPLPRDPKAIAAMERMANAYADAYRRGQEKKFDPSSVKEVGTPEVLPGGLANVRSDVPTVRRGSDGTSAPPAGPSLAPHDSGEDDGGPITHPSLARQQKKTTRVWAGLLVAAILVGTGLIWVVLAGQTNAGSGTPSVASAVPSAASLPLPSPPLRTPDPTASAQAAPVRSGEPANHEEAAVSPPSSAKAVPVHPRTVSSSRPNVPSGSPRPRVREPKGDPDIPRQLYEDQKLEP